MATEVLVLLSGGLDSAVLLSWVRAQAKQPVVVEFDFPGRLNAEKKAAENLARSSGITRTCRVSLPFIENPKETLSNYIPRRNLMFYGIAASLAEQWVVPEIYGGHIKSDADKFPDARPEYFESLNGLMATPSAALHGAPGTVRPPSTAASQQNGNHTCPPRSAPGTTSRTVIEPPRCRIVTPFISMEKPKIVRMGSDLGVPFELTWSCLRDGPSHCWECSSCMERRMGFDAAGILDPLEHT